MRFCVFTLGLSLFLASCSSDPDLPRLTGDEIAAYADSVKGEFLHCWEGYKKYAWGHDELKPLTQTHRDWYGASLLMTPVDAFSTMKIMGLKAAEEAKALILRSLSFDRDMEVQVFEVNIRLLGGLLSAYQLDGDPEFLRLATDLAKRLLPAFRSPTGMPYRYVNLKTGRTRDPVSNPAEIGTLILEWGTLSRITGNTLYYDTAKKALLSLHQRRSNLGFPGSQIHVETGQWLNTETHISGMIDSYYEYLVKGWMMFGDEELKSMWDGYAQAIHQYLADKKEGALWYGRADMKNGRRTKTWFGSLDCFFPAVLALSGDLDRAKSLQRSSFALWTLHGIEPEMLDYMTMETVNEAYYLRPENMESAFTLFQITGDDLYRSMGAVYFDSLVQYCRNETGYAQLSSVKTRKKRDAMESFFLAETLKYAYLLFAPAGTVDFSKVLFNTEAHPLNRWTP